MPALPDYPNVLKIETQFSVGADALVQSRMHFAYTGTAPTSATCATIATDIYGEAVTDLLPLLAEENDLTGVTVTDLTTPSSGFGEHIASNAGTRGSFPLPAEVAVLMNIAIGRRYRGGKPRVYWPFGINTDVLTPSAWSTAALADFLSGIATYIDFIIALSVSGTAFGSLVNISYYEGFTSVTNPITGRTRDVPKVRSVAIAPDVFTGISINPKPGSQRRRQLH